MAQYWVVQGKVINAHFHEALDESEEWIGPFADPRRCNRFLQFIWT